MEYESVKTGKTVPRKTVMDGKNCSNCKFRCSKNISDTERLNINKMFWSLSDESKAHFYSEYTVRFEKQRCRAVTNEKPKVFSYAFYFRCGDTSRKERVCKQFFLTTLNISQRRIQYFYENRRCLETGAPIPPQSGKNVKNKINDEVIEGVRKHINMFPRIPSHYCRSSSSREYLEKSLNLTKMYGLYCDFCAENDLAHVKEHKYREIFYTEFNIGFMAPKKDRCDKCERLSLNPDMQADDRVNIEEHLVRKKQTAIERERDRNDKQKPVLCFDLEHVFSLPISGVSNFFYKRKLCTFNMTGTFSLTKKSYFSVWHEGTGGRTGNNMACAVVRILDEVLLDHPDLSEITLWSDSCVSQNKNSVMTMALTEFMKKHPNLKIIIQKFSEAGHSSIQEVDNVHSVIERHLRHQEVYSPAGLLKKLSTIKNCKVIQLSDFFDYYTLAKQEYNFDRVPFKQVRQLKLCQVAGTVSFKLGHDQLDWTTVRARKDMVFIRKKEK